MTSPTSPLEKIHRENLSTRHLHGSEDRDILLKIQEVHGSRNPMQKFHVALIPGGLVHPKKIPKAKTCRSLRVSDLVRNDRPIFGPGK